MLSYDWLKIVGVIAAVILVWSLIFTMTATRITPAQQFHVLNYVGNYTFGDPFYKMYQGAKNALSYEVMEYKSEDFAANKEYVSTLMTARLSTYEMDVMFVADIANPKTAYEDENKETQYKHTYLETFIADYGYRCFDLSDPTLEGNEKSYFKQMEIYLNAYYSGDWTQEDNLQEELVERDFRARVKTNKDKRYKKESQILAGIEKDIGRIKLYRDGLEQFYQYVAEGYIAYETVEFDYTRGDKTTDHYKGSYSLNICPNEKMENLKEYVGYYDEIIEEDGSKTYVKNATNMNVVFFDFGNKVEEGFEYENVLFINHLVKTCIEASK